MVILKILIFTILAFSALILILLLGFIIVPFHLRGTLTYDQKLEGAFNVGWFWGLFRLKFTSLPPKKFLTFNLARLKILSLELKPTPPEKKKRKAAKKAQKKVKKKEKKRKKKERKKVTLEKQLDKVFASAQTFSFEALGMIISSISHFVASLRIEISGQAEVGLEDPADTGIIMGLFHSVRGTFSLGNFSLQPNWEQEVVRGQASLALRIWLAEIIIIGIKTALSSSIRRIWWPLVKQKFVFSAR